MKTNEDYEAEMRIELDKTIACYEKLLNQCRALAGKMYANNHAIYRGVFPKQMLDRENTQRIKDWFDKNKKYAIHWARKREAEIKRTDKIRKLVDQFNLTQEEKSLLGFGDF